MKRPNTIDVYAKENALAYSDSVLVCLSERNMCSEVSGLVLGS